VRCDASAVLSFASASVQLFCRRLIQLTRAGALVGCGSKQRSRSRRECVTCARVHVILPVLVVVVRACGTRHFAQRLLRSSLSLGAHKNQASALQRALIATYHIALDSTHQTMYNLTILRLKTRRANEVSNAGSKILPNRS
jgi:hypothetical protein